VKVLHLIGSLENGGAEAVLVRLVTAPSDVQHRVVSIGPAEWYSEELAAAGVDLHHLDLRGPASFPAAVRRLKRLIDAFEPDLIQSWMYRANMLAGVLGMIARIPVVWGIHCTNFGRPLRLRSRALARLSGLTAGWLPSRVISCSALAQEAHDPIGYRRAPSTVVANGYDIGRFRPLEPGEQDLRADWKLPADTFVIATVARWHPEKDHANLLNALALLRDQLPSGWACILVGPDIDASNPVLTRLIRKLGLEDRIICLGARRDVDRIMRSVDLHVLSSASEAFPNVVAEAMASGTPCVVTDTGDCGLLVGASGWVVPPGSPQPLAAAILDAYHTGKSDTAAWDERRKMARAGIAESFTIARMSAGYEDAWRETLITSNLPAREREGIKGWAFANRDRYEAHPRPIMTAGSSPRRTKEPSGSHAGGEKSASRNDPASP